MHFLIKESEVLSFFLSLKSIYNWVNKDRINKLCSSCCKDIAIKKIFEKVSSRLVRKQRDALYAVDVFPIL